MRNKYLINLAKVIGIGLISLFALNLVINIFSVDEDKIQSELQSEYNIKYNDEVKSIKDNMVNLTNSINELSILVEKQKVDKTINHYINHVEPSKEYEKQFSKTAKSSFWFYSYGDDGLQGYNVIEMKGVNFDFDRAVKAYRKDGIVNVYGGIVSLKRISYEEFVKTKTKRKSRL